MTGYSGPSGPKEHAVRRPGGGLLLLAGTAVLTAVSVTWHDLALPAATGVAVLLCLLAAREVMGRPRPDRMPTEDLGAGLDDLLLTAHRGIVTYVNAAGADLLGLTPGDVVGQPMSRFVASPPAPGGWRQISLHRDDGTAVSAEAVWVTRGNARQGDIALLLAREVATRLQDGASLREAKDLAELTIRAKSQFIANVSHELRTPLNAIIGFSEILVEDLRDHDVPARIVEYAGDIRESGEHLLAIVNDMLDQAKVDTGNMDLREDVIDVGELVAAALRIVTVRAERGRVRLVQRIGPGTPAVVADGLKMKQILLNLTSNAVKFTKPGGTVAVDIALNPEGGLDLVVSDTGIGMTAGDIEIAVQPFRRIDSVLGRSDEGTGLGLPLAQSLAELHGGELLIESEPGIGTRVTVRLPAGRVHRPPQGDALLGIGQEAACDGI